MTRRRVHAAPRRFWTPEEDAIVRARFPHERTAVVAQALGRTEPSVSQRARGLHLHKTAAYLASPAACRLRRTGDEHPGKATQFKKGQTPVNKGIRRPGWAPGRMKETQFKKGTRSGTAARNWMPVGSTRVIAGTKGKGYLYRKISDVRNVPYTVNWKPEHVLVWEAAHGPIPRGHALAFKNGDRMDIRLDNLECLTRAALMKRNSVHNLPAPIARTVQLLGALHRQIRKRTHHAAQD